MSLPRYAELHCLSNFSFLKGASHPEELVAKAIELGYAALALTDECSLAGVVRAHAEARESGLKLIIGSSFVLDDGLQLVLLAIDRNGYGNLSELITLGRMRCEKGAYRLTRADLDGRPQPLDAIPASAGAIDHLVGMPDCLALWIPARDADDERLDADARWFASTFPDRPPPAKPDPLFVPRRAWIAVEHTHRMDDALVQKRLTALAEKTGLRCVATGNVHMHVRSRKPLQDTLTAIRLNRPVADCGDALSPNAERHLRTRARLSLLFEEQRLEETVIVANQCTFSLRELKYEYPKEIVPDGETQTSYLRKLTEEGLVTRFPNGIVAKVRKQVEHELTLIAELKYEAFFLTVHDIVRYARRVGILCQGRGSAANSAVCYCLGITEVNPALQDMLFERFLTKERDEPPDIDVDFEHQRREEVIQYIFDKYGRHRTALAATVIAYRTKSSIRDVGKALGMDAERVDRLSASYAYWDGARESRERLEENGFDPDSPVVRKLIELTATLRSFPRHLSQHVGGFVISADKLSRMVPIENAAMRKPGDWDDAMGHRAAYAEARPKHDGEVDAGEADHPGPDPGRADEDHDEGGDGEQPRRRARAVRRSRVSDNPSRDPLFGDLLSHGSLPGDPPSRGSLTDDSPSRGSLSGDASSHGSLPGGPPSHGSLPGDPPSRGSLPGDPPSRGSLPGDSSSHGSFPGDPPGDPSSRGSLTGYSPWRGSLTGDPPSRGRLIGDGPALFPTFRSVIQWDKDDLEELGLLKVDVLALGMLSAVRRSLELVGARYGRSLRMIDIPREDPETYAMICKADTVGVFQIESRAQMSMLPRLRPTRYYDLVVEVAIVRPGPIQGGMVHPYLKAREAERRGEEIFYPQPAVREALARTLGVPIFQEQVMQLMMLAADFSAGEADKLRRAMAAWKRKGGLGPFQDRIVEGMVKNGYERDYAERIFRQVEGFGEYGFPESHAASFAFLVYISSWIKCHEPAAFLAAMLNSQPLGFYSSSQLIQDAQRHGVEVRPIDVTVSHWDAGLEETTASRLTRRVHRWGTATVTESPAAGTTTAESPACGTALTESPAHGTTSVELRAAGTTSAESPAHGTASPRSPARGTTMAGSPTAGTTTAESPARGTTMAESPSAGTTSAGSPARRTTSAESPAAGTTTAESPARGTASARSPARGTTSAESPARGTTSAESPVAGTTSAESPAGNTTPAESPACGTTESAGGAKRDTAPLPVPPAVRLGFNSVKGFNRAAALRVVTARAERPFDDVDDLGRRAALGVLELEALAAADALTALVGHRRQARWQAASHRIERDLMRVAPIQETLPGLPVASEGREIVDDYASTGFTLRRHPLALLRPRLKAMRLSSAREMHDLPDGTLVRTTGIVTVRQRPGTAKGTIFITLEDETGVINVIVWNHVIDRQRRTLLAARLLTTYGLWQRQGDVRHVVAQHVIDHSALLGDLVVESRDFH